VNLTDPYRYRDQNSPKSNLRLPPVIRDLIYGVLAFGVLYMGIDTIVQNRFEDYQSKFRIPHVEVDDNLLKPDQPSAIFEPTAPPQEKPSPTPAPQTVEEDKTVPHFRKFR